MTMRAPVSAPLRQIAESENDEGDNDAVAVEGVVLDDDHDGDEMVGRRMTEKIIGKKVLVVDASA